MFNWGISHETDEVLEATNKKLSVEEGDVPWMYEASKCAPQEALRNLDSAYQGFFRRCKSGAKQKGFPRFKSRKNGIGSFRLNGTIKVFEDNIQLPPLGRIRVKEHGYLPVEGVKILSATVSESAGRWFVSLQVEQEIEEQTPKPTRVIGVDVGIKHLAVTSEGEVFFNPKALNRAQKTLRIRQKVINRKVKGSANRRKAVVKVAKLHRRVVNIRKETIHKMTHSIAKNASIIVIEDLNVSGMLKNHCLARALSDASFSEIHRQLAYKAKWYGVELIKAPRFYPSSKRCSYCGNVKDRLDLSERSYSCESCGVVLDRDLNAAKNLENLAGSFPVSACCPEGSDLDPKIQMKLLVGQEPSRKELGNV